MPSLVPFAATIALLVPILGQSSAMLAGPDAAKVADDNAAAPAPVSAGPDYEQPPEQDFSQTSSEANPLDALYAAQTWRQVRIEQRVTIRISPRPPSNRNELLAQLPPRGLQTTFEEREMDRCVPVNGIVGVQTGNGNRLLLFLSDDRIVTINLERACRARDFYSGFYVERNEDGRLCVDRDQLQSRSGAKCEIERMRQLVAVEE